MKPVVVGQTNRVRTARVLCLASAVLVAALGVAVIVGWAWGISDLKSIVPDTVTMKANTALGVAMSGVALVLLQVGGGAAYVRSVLAAVLIGATAAIGLLTLVEYALGANLGIDQLLFHERVGAVGTSSPGRMAIATAAVLTVNAASLALVRRGPGRVQQLLAGIVTLAALTGILTYVYGTALARPRGTTQAAAQTVAAFTVLAIGLLTARPREGPVSMLLTDEPGAIMARSLLTAGVIVLPILGGLRLAGQQAGLYGSSAGVGLMVIISLTALAASTAITARRLTALGRQRSRALDRLAASQRRLRRTLSQLVEVEQRERRRLAGDLHDDAVPALAAVSLQLELARGRCGDRDVDWRLERAEGDLRAATQRLRLVMFDLMPQALAREGLGPALRRHLDQIRELTGVEYQLRDRIGMSASPEAAATLYRITLEAVRNVQRHAHASRIQVELGRRDGILEATVADDGVGIDAAGDGPGHLGLTLMRERAELAGGGIEIRSHRGGGTTVAVWVPQQTRPD